MTTETITEDRIDEAIDRASQAFWASIVEQFPEVKTGDYQGNLDDQMKDALKDWLMLNHPSEHVRDTV